MMDQAFEDGVLIQSREDHGDGTATLTDHTTDPPTVTQLTGMPIYEQWVEPPTPEVVAAQAISDEISSRIGSAETVSELRLAITDGLAAAITSLGG
jgi:hypothetical protein